MSRRRNRRARAEETLRFLRLCAILTLLTAAVLAAAALRLFRRAPAPAEVDGRVPDYVTRDLLTVNEWSRPGDPLKKVSGIVLHYVGNPGTSARANRNYFDSLADGALGTYASSHFIVGLEGEVLQCVPLSEIAYASNTRNGDTVSVEVCHPDKGGEYSPVTYARVVELTAWLCREFRLDPEEDVIRHYDVTGKLCPLYYVENPEAWDALRADIASEVRALEEAEKHARKNFQKNFKKGETKPPSESSYRIDGMKGASPYGANQTCGNPVARLGRHPPPDRVLPRGGGQPAFRVPEPGPVFQLH